MFIGTGTSISFATGFLCEVLDVTPPGAKRESIPSSHMLTVNDHTFKPAKLVDRGELKVDIAFNPATEPPIDEAPETIVITFPDSSNTTWTFTGFMMAYEPKDPLEDRATASVTIKVTGGVTIG